MKSAICPFFARRNGSWESNKLSKRSKENNFGFCDFTLVNVSHVSEESRVRKKKGLPKVIKPEGIKNLCLRVTPYRSRVLRQTLPCDLP